MYAIGKDGVRAEGADEKAAKRELRKRMAAQRKRDEEAAAKHKVAEMEAMANGYRVYSVVGRAAGKKLHVPWRLCAIREGGYGVARVFCQERDKWGYKFEGQGGDAIMFPFHGNHITHWLCNGAGFPLAVVMQNDGKELMLACGICEGVVVLRDLPGVTPGLFQKELE